MYLGFCFIVVVQVSSKSEKDGVFGAADHGLPPNDGGIQELSQVY